MAADQGGVITAERAPQTRRIGPVESFLSWLVKGENNLASQLLLLPTSFWLTVFLLVPLGLLLATSFAQRGDYGSIVWHFSFGNYLRALNPEYLPILLRSVRYALAATIVCLILGYPFAYYVSFFVEGRKKDLFLIALMIPFWSSCLISIYSWIIILGSEGLINSLLPALGLPKIQFLNTSFSVILGLTYFYLPFMVLPLYSSLEKIPKTYLEASKDLGAGCVQTFLKVTVPLSFPGIFAGVLLTFIPCVGDFLTAEFLGGPQNYLVGNLIQNQFMMAQDWPFGAALASLLIFFLLSGLWVYKKLEGRSLGMELR